MTLFEAIETAARADSDYGTIYAQEPWTPESSAVVVEDKDDTIPVEHDGIRHAYFLEGFIVCEVLEGYLASTEGQSASARQVCERIILYALNDA